MKILVEIYQSARSLPVWVQIWVFFILIPVNVAVDRGFTHKMAIAHLLPWTVLVVLIGYWLVSGAITARSPLWYFAWIVLVVDTISLLFDYRDSYHWLKKTRAER